MDTLAVRLTVPPTGPVKDLHLQVGAPCRAHNKKSGRIAPPALYFLAVFLFSLYQKPKTKN
jgi:hypothetical protein